MDLFYQSAIVILGSAVAILLVLVLDLRSRERTHMGELASMRASIAWLGAHMGAAAAPAVPGARSALTPPAAPEPARAARAADDQGDETLIMQGPLSGAGVRDDAAPPSSLTAVSPGGAAPRGKARR